MQPNVRMQMNLKTLALCLSCAVAGCDDQVSPDYVGESLLTVNGNVEITHVSSQGQLIPALAFLNRDAGQLHIMEVTVLGEFPSDFRFDVYERPRADAFFDAEGPPPSSISATSPGSSTLGSFARVRAKRRWRRPSSSDRACALRCRMPTVHASVASSGMRSTSNTSARRKKPGRDVEKLASAPTLMRSPETGAESKGAKPCR